MILRPLAYWLSQYFWFLIVAVMVFLGLLCSSERFTGAITSMDEEFSTAKDPIIFSHMSDIHVNSKIAATQANFDKALKKSESYSVDAIVVTGDLVDNFGRVKRPKYGHQYLNDWKVYRKIVNKHKFRPDFYYDLTGNHDEFGLWSYDSKNHYLLDWSFYSNRTMFPDRESSRFIHIDIGDCHIMYLNPYYYPNPHPSLEFWVTPWKGFLDQLEREISRLNTSKTNILSSHYPIECWNNRQASDGRHFKEIISDGRIDYIMTGHVHPAKTFFLHHKGVLEEVAPDTEKHKGFTLVAVDNGQASFHHIKNDSNKKFIVTYPIPVEQLSSHHVFNKNKIPVRLLSFGDINASIYANNVKMEYRSTVKDGVFLFEAEVRVPSGKSTLLFTGDYVASQEVFVGTHIGSYGEIIYGKPETFDWVINSMFCVSALLFIIAFPITPQFIDKLNDRFNVWLTHDDENDFWMWILSLTPIPLHCRIQKLNEYIRYGLLAAVVYPLLLPTSFFMIDNHIGFTATYGFFIGSEMRYAEWGQLYTLLYFGVALIPLIIYTSGFGLSEWHWVRLLDILMIPLSAIGCIFAICRFMYASSGWLAWICPVYTIIPIIGFVGITKYRNVREANSEYEVITVHYY